MKNKSKLHIFIFILLAFFASIHVAAADEEVKSDAPCTEEQKENIQKSLVDNLQGNFDVFKSKVAVYNTLAKDYYSSCLHAEGSVQNPARPTVDDAATAQTYGINIENDSLYEYLGADWDKNLVDTPECIQKHKDANAAFGPAADALSQLKKNIQPLKNSSGTNCSCNADGTEMQCTTLNKETEQVENQDSLCSSLTGIMQSLSSCPLCGIFEAILSASARVANIAWDYAATPLSEVVCVFFLVILAVESLKAVASVSGFKISAYLKSVLAIGIKIVITVFLLSNSQPIYEYFISPVLKGGLDMGLSIASVSGNVQCSDENEVGASIPSPTLDAELFNKTLNTVRCFGKSASTLPAVGMGLLCHGSLKIMKINLPDFHMIFSGLILLGIGLMIWMSLSFYLIDCTVQVGMLCTLVPLLIACWPFNLTKQYTTKGVKMLMNTFFNYAMMGTVLLIGSEIIAFAITGDGELSLTDLINALNNNEVEKVKKLSALDSMRVLVLLACSIFTLKLIAKANGLANQFSQGAGADIASGMGTTLVGAATAAGKGFVLRPAGRIIGNLGNRALESSGLKAGFNTIADKALEKRRGALGALGRQLGLGQYQNQQTGSGIAPTIGNGDKGTRGIESNERANAEDYEENQDLETQDLENQDLETQDLENQDLENQDLENQDLETPNNETPNTGTPQGRPNRGQNATESGRQHYENRNKHQRPRTLKDMKAANQNPVAAPSDNNASAVDDEVSKLPEEDNNVQPSTAKDENTVQGNLDNNEQTENKNTQNQGGRENNKQTNNNNPIRPDKHGNTGNTKPNVGNGEHGNSESVKPTEEIIK